LLAISISLICVLIAASEDPRDMVRGQKGYKKGGVTRADGCITKAHTKGKMVKMAGGGMC